MHLVRWDWEYEIPDSIFQCRDVACNVSTGDPWFSCRDVACNVSTGGV